MQKDAFYFPHFSNARNDRKILRLRKELGIEGYGIFFMLLEVLRDQPNFKYPMSEIDLLADQFCTSEQKVRTVIANYNLFEIDTEQNLFSARFNEYMEPYLSMKQQRIEAGIKSGIARRNKALQIEDRTVVERELNGSSTVAEQSKVKESKVKKRKVNEINTPLTPQGDGYTADFLIFWNLYPRKESKATAYKAWKKITDKKTALEKITEILPMQKQSAQWVKEGGQFVPLPATYLNAHKWDDSVETYPSIPNGQIQPKTGYKSGYNQNEMYVRL